MIQSNTYVPPNVKCPVYGVQVSILVGLIVTDLTALEIIKIVKQIKGASPVYLSREVIAKQRKEKEMQIDCKSKRRYGYPEPESAFSGSNIQIQLFYQVNVYIDGKFFKPLLANVECCI